MYKVYVRRKTTSSVMRANNMETKTLSAPSSTTGTNSSNYDVSMIVGIGEDAESLEPAAAEPGFYRRCCSDPSRLQRMQQTVDGVIL